MPPKTKRDFSFEDLFNQTASIEELRSGIQRLTDRFDTHRTVYQGDLSGTKESTTKSFQKAKQELDGIVKELEEAFKVVLPRISTLEAGIKNAHENAGQIDTKHEKAIALALKQIENLSSVIDKNHTALTKKLANPQIQKIIETNTVLDAMRLELNDVSDLLKKVAKYEYGSQLGVLVGGKFIGFTGSINFKTGFTYVLTGSQIDIVATSSGGGGFTYLNEIVSGAGTAYTLAHVPAGSVTLYARGQRLTPGAGNDYTITGASITTALTWGTGDLLADYS